MIDCDEILSDPEIDNYIIECSDDFISSAEKYECLYENAKEDFLFSNIDVLEINNIVLDALKVKNFRLLDYVVNNAHDLMFDINSTIKNRSFLEVALFFNDYMSVTVLLNNDIKSTSRLSNSCRSWISDNYTFMSNPMHDKYNDKDWKSDLIRILSSFQKHGWPEISKTAAQLLLKNQSQIYTEVGKSISVKGGRDTDYERLLELLNRLPADTREKLKKDLK